MEELAEEVESHAHSVASRVTREDTLTALNNLRAMQHYATELAMALVEQGAREGKTQKALAEAIGVPPSTLRGLKATL